MGKYNFKEDLKTAKKTEEAIANLLSRKYNVEILETENNTNEYDIIALLKGVPTKIEIKEDFKCAETGNVAVEFECRGKPSGIAVTHAEWIIYVIHLKNDTVVVMQETDVLKKKIKDNKYIRIVNGGDKDSNTMNYLFRYGIFVGNSFYL